ncbi:Hypothetical predicted protein [Lecanosticta acicola]|uniref:ATPase synthesis protein 25 n=1 Tax=Lecanosticta acicola TaxID=111012 RepID=A0AAI8Z2F4_9PEZI|nr:Hypothetical predicted protein [Lecanosticta acicola]
MQKVGKEGLTQNDIDEDVEKWNETQTEHGEDLDRDVLRRQHQTSEAKLDPEVAASSNTDEHVPWYLQVDTSLERTNNVISERQRLPDLPEHPPTILQPLLERVSVELGMDDLSLLDLRAIEPPPALGANLFMIIGTARSEKHLHFSADKLCRWLRTEFHLRPVADGLLGRQELKLKTRRRAKKSRLLSAVGAKSTADTELDEGIRTGWICVNVGKVEGGQLPRSPEQIEREKDIVGFGTEITGSHIVVQLLTEDKRGEMDLEKLWTTILRRSKRERDYLEEKEPDLAEHELEASSDVSAGKDNSNQAHPAGQSSYHPMMTSVSQQHARAYHTSARTLNGMTVVHRPVSDHLRHPSRDSQDPDRVTGTDASLAELTSVVSALQKMPPSAALEALGPSFDARSLIPEDAHVGQADAEGGGSTPLVDAFNKAMPHFPQPAHWHARVQLICHAYRLEHPGCDESSIMLAFEQMRLSGVVPNELSYITALVSLLKDSDNNLDTYEPRLETVFDLLEEMDGYGYNALRPEILQLLHQCLVGQPTGSSITTVQTLLPALSIATLKRHLASQDIVKFWRAWCSYPRRFLPRQGDMYVVLFDAIANEQLAADVRGAREMVGMNLVDMEVEEPAVAVEQECVELAMSVFKAMRFADPDDQLREWDGMRGRCEAVLRAALAKR